MPTAVRIRSDVQAEHLHPTSRTLTKDGQGRLTQLRFNFLSFRIDYDVTWNGSAIEITTMTKTVTDL